MANITWRSQAAPSFAGPAAMMKAGNQAMTDAFQNGANILTNIGKQNVLDQEKAKQQATEGFQAQLLNAGSPEARQNILAQAAGSDVNQLALAQANQGQQDRATINTLNNLKISNAELDNKKNIFDVNNQGTLFNQDILKSNAAINASNASAGASNAKTKATNFTLQGQQLDKQHQGALNDFFTQKEFQITDKNGNTYPDWNGITNAAAKEDIPLTLVEQFKSNYDNIADNKVDPKVAAEKIKAAAKKVASDAKNKSRLDVAKEKTRFEREAQQDQTLLHSQDRDWLQFLGDNNQDQTKALISQGRAANLNIDEITNIVKSNSDSGGNLNIDAARIALERKKTEKYNNALSK